MWRDEDRVDSIRGNERDKHWRLATVLNQIREGGEEGVARRNVETRRRNERFRATVLEPFDGVETIEEKYLRSSPSGHVPSSTVRGRLF